MSVTLEDLAKRAQVSVSTVSRVLNHSSHPISQETRSRILALAQDYGYVPNKVARNLKSNRSSTIGVVVDNIASPFAGPILQGIQDQIKPHGYSILVQSTYWNYEHENHTDEMAAVKQLLSYQVDGFILVDTWLHESNNHLDALDQPVIYVNRLYPSHNQNCVGTDDRAGARTAVRHLAELGHHRIAFINGPSNWIAAQNRLIGYQEELAAWGIPLDDALLITQGTDWTINTGRTFTTQLLQLAQPPTAIFAASDHIAAGVIIAAGNAGLRIPQDIALIGYDNADFAELLNPPLSSIAMPSYEMGDLAAQWLLQDIEGMKRAQTPGLLKGDLIVRASCGAASAASRNTQIPR